MASPTICALTYFVLGVTLQYVQYSTASSIDDGRNGKVVFCYVATWATYRPSIGAFQIENIDPSLCTHLIYAFAGLDPNTWKVKPLDPSLDLKENNGKDGYGRMTDLKDQNPNLKVLVAIGGWNEGSKPYSIMAADQKKRGLFVESVIQMIEDNDFDGIDLDWEYPGKRGGSSEDQKNFVTLLKELNSALKPEGYLLTVALAASIETAKSSYDVPGINEAVNFMSIMTYDYSGLWDSRTGPNAPLTKSESNSLSIMDTLEYYKTAGASLEKLLMGLPFYGKTFKLLDAPPKNGTKREFGERSVKNKSGFLGDFTKNDGTLAFYEICKLLREGGNWTEDWDVPSSTPRADNDEARLVVSFDNNQSIALKVVTAMKLGLGGVMVWSIDMDDFRGVCGPKYPLLNVINERIKRASETPKKKKDVSLYIFYVDLFIKAIKALLGLDDH